MLMENIPHTFTELNIFEAADAAKLHHINPVHQIPVLIDDEKHIWDSRIIFQYLNVKHGLESMDWQKENMLTAMDGAMNAGVTLLLSKRSGLNVEDDVMYFTRQKERMASILDYLKPYLTGIESKEWNVLSMTLYSFLDWATFRQLLQIEARPECLQFLETHSSRPSVQATLLPKG
jgi:glutathione S-transferase